MQKCMKNTIWKSWNIVLISAIAFLSLSGFNFSPAQVETEISTVNDSSSVMPIKNMDSQGDFSCAVTLEGGVKCWGSIFGGDWFVVNQNVPVYVQNLRSGIKDVSIGADFVCVLTDSGGVKCWGNNSEGQLGNGTIQYSDTPVDVIDMQSGVEDISSVNHHSCALMTNGDVKCWGDNSEGWLGDGTTFLHLTPVKVIGLSGAPTRLSGTCVIINGGVQCWGNNHLSPEPVNGLTNGVEEINVGTSHSCAILQTGALKCWGGNYYGELGDGTTNNSDIPVDVDFGESIRIHSVAVSKGESEQHTCAITEDGDGYCWGSNSLGQLHVENLLIYKRPMLSFGSVFPSAILVAGGQHTCLADPERFICWGDNHIAQLGNERPFDNPVPTVVEGLSGNVTDVAMGALHTVAIVDGGVKQWGEDPLSVWNEGRPFFSNIPTSVATLENNLKAISAGGSFSCAVTNSGAAKCWGINHLGQLGAGDNYSNPGVVNVAGLSSGIVDIQNGKGGMGNISCALTSAGGVKCWGAGDANGDGTFEEKDTPVNVVGLSSGVKAITLGASHACALLTNGSVKCWGQNFLGQLGNGQTSPSGIPVSVQVITEKATAISAGGYDTCVLTESGRVQCWGPDYGQGEVISNLPPNIRSISVGEAFACALSEGGKVVCWGFNTEGQLGNGDMTPTWYPPTTVKGLDGGVTTMKVGSSHSCAIKNNRLWCWGRNDDGQLGSGEAPYSWAGVNVSWSLNSSTTTISTDGGTLSSSGNQTEFNFLSGTFSNEVNVIQSVPFPINIPANGDQLGIGHAYEIAAVDPSTEQLVQPGHSYTVTIHYLDSEIGPVIENSLALFYWDGVQWRRESTSQINPSTNTISASPDHFSLWAVFGATNRVFLPSVHH